jgi:hypothetical protein
MTQPITTRVFQGGKKTGSKKLHCGDTPVVAPDGNREIKTESKNAVKAKTPKSPLNK